MAALLRLVLVLGVSAANAVTIAADKSTETSSVIRRESQAVHLHSSGNMNSLTQERHAQSLGHTNCNRQFIMIAEGSDECTGDSKNLETKGICETAATHLKLEQAEYPGFFMTNHEVNPVPHPHGCFLDTTAKKVFYNPTASDSANMTGKKICVRDLYIKGTVHSDIPDGCTGDSKPIEDTEDCWYASHCVSGGGAARLPAMRDNNTDFKSEFRPKGCYRDDEGQWNFNYIETTPTGPIEDGTPVCLNVYSAAATTTDDSATTTTDAGS